MLDRGMLLQGARRDPLGVSKEGDREWGEDQVGHRRRKQYRKQYFFESLESSAHE
jgi:hypothetical protein